MQQRLLSLVAIALGLSLTQSHRIQAQVSDLVTVIVTLRSQASGGVRAELTASMAAASQTEPVAADRARAVAVGRALAQIGAEIASNSQEVREAVLGLGGTVLGTLRSHGLVIARVPRGAISQLLDNPGVVAVDEDVLQRAALEIATATMGVPAFWAAGFTGGATDVAVVDSGLYLANEAFAPRAASEICGVFHTSAVSHPAYSDDALSCYDFQGHGTGVIGMIFSQGTPAFPLRRGTGFGIDRLYNLKVAFRDVIGQGRLFGSDAYLAIDAALGVTDPPEVINYSYGSPAASDDDPTARFFDGVADTFSTVVTISAGNGGALSIDNSATTYNAIVVANVDDQGTSDRGDDVINSSSSRGPTPGGRRKPDVAAPGTGILSHRI